MRPLPAVLLCALSGCSAFSAATQPDLGGNDMGVGPGPPLFQLQTYPVGSGLGPVAGALSDLNGDGFADLVVANPFGNKVTVLLNDGHGGFPPPLQQVLDRFSGPSALAIADVNQDGTQDLLVANAGADFVDLLQNPRGTPGLFNPGPDARTKIPVGQKPVALATGNLGAGPGPDLVVANSDSASVTVIANLQTPQRKDHAAFTPLYGVILADLNGDGQKDLILPDAGAGCVTVLWNNGGSFSFTPDKCNGLMDGCSSIRVDQDPVAVVAADFNGDQALDLAVANYGSNTVTVLLNQGNTPGKAPAFAAISYQVGDGPVALAAGALSGGSLPDLLVAERGSGKVHLLQNQGGGRFPSAPTGEYDAGAAPVYVAIRDLNNDQQPDFVTLDAMDNSVRIFLNITQERRSPAPR